MKTRKQVLTRVAKSLQKSLISLNNEAGSRFDFTHPILFKTENIRPNERESVREYQSFIKSLGF